MDNEVFRFHCRIFGTILLPTAGGCVGAVLVRKYKDPWYKDLKKPTWTPPDKAYGPIRAVIHTGIGVASYLVYRDGDGFNGPAKLPLILYGANLALNLSWAPVFFYLKNLDFGFWALKLITISSLVVGRKFSKINKKAAWLYVPYIIYLGFNTVLLYNINRSNRRSIQE